MVYVRLVVGWVGPWCVRPVVGRVGPMVYEARGAPVFAANIPAYSQFGFWIMAFTSLNASQKHRFQSTNNNILCSTSRFVDMID